MDSIQVPLSNDIDSPPLTFDADSCIFPTLIDNVNTTEHVILSEPVEVDIPHTGLEKNFFEVAWALLLRVYLGTNSTLFACSSSQGHVITRRVIPEHLTITALLNSPRQINDIGGSSPLYNTAIYFRKGHPSSSTKEYRPAGIIDLVVNYDPESANPNHIYSLFLEASSDILSKNTIKNVAATLSTIISRIWEYGSIRVEELDVLSDRDRDQIRSWNFNYPQPAAGFVHDLISEISIQQPDVTAICSWDGDLTYAELDDMSSRLAHYMISLGVGPEVHVVTCFPKSIWMAVTMMALLKSGGVCIPIDPHVPATRQEAVIHAVGATIAVIDHSFAPKFVGKFKSIVADVKSLISTLPHTGLYPSKDLRPSNAAFVMFSSGSTGTPKGIIQHHEALTVSAMRLGEVMHLESNSRIIQFSAWTFDASAGDILATLLRRGCVCIPSDEERVNDLGGAINRLQVTHACLSPTIAGLLDPSTVPTLKVLALGGEALTRENLSIWADHVNLINLYGVTECLNWSSVREQIKSSDDPLNIGQAFGGVYWIAYPERRDRLAPIGSVGRLMIEGPNVTRGYLNDPVKTSNAFIENPIWSRILKRKPPKIWRAYDTGDLARYNSDGTICFLGRKDTQVKLHGQRIDLAGIEHQIKLHQDRGVQVVVELIHRGSTQMLGAFLCLPGVSELVNSNHRSLMDAGERWRTMMKTLVELLSEVLPPFMVPSVYLPMREMPVTSSGKMDRKVLCLFASELPDEVFTDYIPREKGTQNKMVSDPIAMRLRNLWSQVLQMPPKFIGAEDGFLKLGGDSVKAMRLVASARTKSLFFTVADVFRCQTLEELASVTKLITTEKQLESFTAPFSMLISPSETEKIREKAKELCQASTIQDAYPCTPMQEGLMALTIKDPNAYISQFVFDLPSSISLTRFREAWDLVVAKTPILRTRIIQSTSGVLYQIVTDDKIQWKSSASLENYLNEDSQVVTSLGGPLSRYAIVTGLEQHRQFVWTAHHAIYDGWCFRTIFESLSLAYANGCCLPGKPGFNKFIKYIQEVDSRRSDSFWIETLAGVNQPSFPSLTPNTLLNANYETVSHRVSFGRSKGSSTTMATVLQAAWALIVARYSDCEDVVFGATSMGRNAPLEGIDSIAGPTITTVPVRVAFTRTQSVESFLRTVQAQVIDRIPYEHAGTQNIKRLSADTALACEFQNLLVVQTSSDMDITGNSLGIQRVDTTEGMFHPYPLVIECSMFDGGANIRTQHDTNIISNFQMERILYQFSHVVQQLNLESLLQTVGDIEIMSIEDKVQFLEWNKVLPSDAYTCAHELIREQVLSRRDALAVDAWDATFTYEELDRVSTRLAHHLIGLGIGPEIFVGLCFEKSAYAVVAMLAVMKSGGAFVPLDHTHPMNRRREIINQTKATVILASVEQSLGWDELNVVVVDSTWVTNVGDAVRDVASQVQPHNTLYLIFTSGSTGKPKGFVIEHSAFCSAALGQGRRAMVNQDTRIFQFSSYSFDVSILEIVTGLIFGGCICIASTDATKNINKAIRDMRVTWTCLTPSVLRLVQPASVPDLKTVVVGGEAVSKSDVSLWWDKVQFILGYGPSECSVAATSTRPLTLSSNPDNFGTPMASLCWIVDPDDHNRLAPLGTVGEIMIEGPILARCYLNDEERTAAAFIPAPKWLQEAAALRRPRQSPVDSNKLRLYKSGDLGRFHDDGSIIFVARKDRQVKVRGQRVELAEIEHHLSKVPEIRHSVVEFPGHGTFRKKLVLVVSLREVPIPAGGQGQLRIVGGELHDQAIKRANQICNLIANALPPYMVPTVKIVVEDMPFTPSGKINRVDIKSWLSTLNDEIYHQVIGQDENFDVEDKGTALEESIRRIWARVLQLKAEQISFHKTFFQLGGDSILAMQVMSTCREEGIVITVPDILRCQTISKLAEVVVTAEQSAPRVWKEQVNTPSVLSLAQLIYFDTAARFGTDRCNISVLVRLTRHFSSDEVGHGVKQLVQQHSMLRSRFSRDDLGGWAQYIAESTYSAYRYTTSEVKKYESPSPIFAASQNSLNIENGPIFAVDLVTRDNGDQLLYLVAHHLAIDLVSLRILTQDLERLFISAPLPPSSLPFQEWCRLQHDYCKDRAVVENRLPSNLPPVDYRFWGLGELDANTMELVAQEVVSVDAAVTSSILKDSRTALRTEPIDVILAALISSFGRVFPERKVPPIFNEGHGRESWAADIDVSRTVGWFTTFSPLLVDTTTSNCCDLTDLLCRVKDARALVSRTGLLYPASRNLDVPGQSSSKYEFPVELLLNYAGVYRETESTLLQQISLPENEMVPDFGPNLPRVALMSLELGVYHGELKAELSYNKNMQYTDRMSVWMQKFKSDLIELNSRLLTMDHEFTLSDFPLMQLDLDRLHKFNTTTLMQMGKTTQDIEDVYPCSALQQGILVSQSRKDGSGVYENRTCFEVLRRSNGPPVDVSKLREAWKLVVHRHGMLRTVLFPGIAQEGLFDQVLLSHSDVDVSIVHSHSYESWRKSNREPINRQLFQPPHRLCICSTDDGRVFCELDFNHAILDGESSRILVQDLGLAYDDTLPRTFGPQYSQLISYIQQTKSSSNNYWKSFLDGVTPCYIPALVDTAYPTNKLLSIEIESGVSTTMLTDFCVANGNTLAALFQLAWGLVLRTYTGSDQVCFGYMNSGRDTPIQGIQDAVGPYITVLASRVSLADNFSVKEALDEIQSGYIKSLPHQHFGLAEIQRAAGLTGEPLFNSGISFQRILSQESNTTLSFDVLEEHQPTEYDVTLQVDVTDQIVKIVLSHWTSKISQGHAANIAETFKSFLQRVIDNPRATVRNLDLISLSDRNQLSKWNSKELCRLDQCIHTAIERRTSIRPHDPAVDAWDGQLTYLELNTLAEKLGHHLNKLGVGPECIVPLCFEKSVFVLVSMIAVLKAGGVLAMLDPSSPINRLHEIAGQVDARVAITSRTYSDKISPVVEQVVVVDQDLLDNLPEVKQPVASSVSPRNAAYVVFTSGSTGRPKGIVVEHDSFCSGAKEQAIESRMKPDSRVLQFASFTFDVSIMETFTSLIHGACVCMPSEAARSSSIVDIINDFRITWAFLTPSMIKHINPLEIRGLETLILGGEALSQSNIEVWFDKVHLRNGYGPSECSVAAACNTTIDRDTRSANIGRALGGCCWIVDANDHNKLLPIGAIGELLIQGPIIARGYLGDPDKTASAFIENPSWMPETSWNRFYKTGDLVRYCADGSILFIGRKDTQVKVRGQRIELGEIEHHLESSSSIKHSMVVLPSKGPLRGNLVGVVSLLGTSSGNPGSSNFIKLVSGTQRTLASSQITAISDEISTHLPSYMVPSAWVVLEELPLLQSGKLERSKVKAWVENLDSETHRQIFDSDNNEIQLPSNEIEEKLRSIWSTVLSVPLSEIGTNTPFLRLGGDSIFAMQVVAHCRMEHWEIGVPEILRCRTIAQLASFIISEGPSASNGVFPQAMDPSPAQEQFLSVASRMQDRQNINHFTRKQLLRPTKWILSLDMENALYSLVQNNPSLRARFIAEERKFFTADDQNSFKFTAHAVSSPHEATVIMETSEKSLDIRNGPLFSADLFELADGSQTLFLVAHHLAIDAKSWSPLLVALTAILDHGTSVVEKQLALALPKPIQGRKEIGENVSRTVLSNGIALNGTTHAELTNDLNLEVASVRKCLRLDEKSTRTLLNDCSRPLRTSPGDILLSVILASFYVEFGHQVSPRLLLTKDLRHDMSARADPSEAIGCSTAILPIDLAAEPTVDIIQLAKECKLARLRSLKDGNSRLANGDEIIRILEDSKQSAPVIIFNASNLNVDTQKGEQYLEPIYSFDGRSFSDLVYLPGLEAIDITAAVHGNCLDLTFSRNKLYDGQTGFTQWVSNCEKLLPAAIAKFALMMPEVIPEDFPLLSLAQSDFDRLVEEYLPKVGVLHADIIEDIYPCSPMQNFYLVKDSQIPDHAHERFFGDIIDNTGRNPIDAEKLGKAWQEVVDRHAILRTVFIPDFARKESYNQLVLSNFTADVSYTEVDDVSEASIIAKTVKPTNHTNYKPPHRLALFLTPTGQVFFRLDSSHALVDATAAQLLIRDWSLAYHGQLPKVNKPLYSDYISYLKSPSFASATEYWKKYLFNIQKTQLPVTNDLHSRLGKCQSVTLEELSKVDVREFCKTQEITKATLLYTVWSLVLGYYSRNGPVSFEYIVAGGSLPARVHPDMVGPVVETLVCHTDLHQKASVTQIFEEIQLHSIEALPHRCLGMEDIFTTIGVPRSFHKTSVNFRKFQPDPSAEVGFELSFIPRVAEGPIYHDIVVIAEDSEHGFEVTLRYRDHLLKDNLGVEIARTFHQFMVEVLAMPERTVQEIFAARV